MLLFYLFVMCLGATLEDEPDLSQAVFPHIDNKQERATEVTAPPPWIARVYASLPTNEPFMMCSAVCVKAHIFITASRCLVTLRVPFTYVGYQEKKLRAKAFVRDPKSTKQMHNDISFIITVLNISSPANWQPIKIIANHSWSEHYEDRANVVGYVGELSATQKMTYKVYELPVQVSTEVCSKQLFSQHYWLPCFFCIEHTQNNQTCQKYLRGLGHAVVQKQGGNEDTLLGITTWAVVGEKPLPVGFAVPTAAFYQNMDCAEKIDRAGQAWTYDGELDLKSVCVIKT